MKYADSDNALKKIKTHRNGEYMEEVKFNVTMRVKDMYKFMMRHAYSGFGGIANMVISLGALGLLIAGFGKGDNAATVILIIMALLFTVINPIFLFYKAAKQVKLNPMFTKPLEYTVNEQGITVRQDEQEAAVTWEEVTKVIEKKDAIYIYLSLTRSFIFSKDYTADGTEAIKNMIKANVKGKVKLLQKN